MADEPKPDECKCEEEEPKKRETRGRKPVGSTVFKTTVWNPFKKKCESFCISVRPGEDMEKAKADLVKWRENRKAELRSEQARLVIQEEEEKVNILNSRYDIKPLKIDLDFTTGRVFGFIGSTGSGKTTLMKRIYQEYFEPENFVTILFAANKEADIYKDFGRDVVRMEQFDDRIPKMEKTIQKGTNMKYKFLNILDDQVDTSTKNNEILKKMITSYRNSQIYSFITLQDKVLLSSINRGNLHRIFFMKMNSEEAIERIIKTYLSSFLGGRSTTISEKIKLYQELTSERKYIMLDSITDTYSVHSGFSQASV